MSYAFEIKMICGGYVYFNTFTLYKRHNKNREVRKPDQVLKKWFSNNLRYLGHSAFNVNDQKSFDIWLRAKGWALVQSKYAHKSMPQWLKSKECIRNPTGLFTDVQIVAPKTLKRSYSGIPKKEILKRDGNKCLECGADTNLTMQHIIPFSHGGETTSRNLVTLCDHCNQKIGNNSSYSHCDIAGLPRNYDRSIINHKWYDLEHIDTAAKLSQNLMQTRCEIW